MMPNCNAYFDLTKVLKRNLTFYFYINQVIGFKQEWGISFQSSEINILQLLKVSSIKAISLYQIETKLEDINMLPSSINSTVFERITQNTTYQSIEAKGPMLDRVYSMRYKSYSEKEFIEKNMSEKFMDEYDGTPNCTSFLTYFEGKAIGSIRGCLHDPSDKYSIPISDVFYNEIDRSVGFGKKMLEINKFVISPHFQRRGGLRARFAIYDNVVSLALKNEAEYLVAGVREEHIDYNRKMFGFELASDLMSYPHLNFKTALMVCEDIASVKAKIDSKLKTRTRFNDSSPRYGVC